MQEQPDRGDDSNDSSESGRAPSIDESSSDDGGLSIGEESGMGSMAVSVASDIFDLADSHDLSDEESEASHDAMCVALAEYHEPIMESECVSELLA